MNLRRKVACEKVGTGIAYSVGVTANYDYYHLGKNHFRVGAGGMVEKWFNGLGWKQLGGEINREWLEKFTWRDETNSSASPAEKQ